MCYKKIFHIICEAHPGKHTNPLYESLRGLTIKQTRWYSVGLLMYKLTKRLLGLSTCLWIFQMYIIIVLDKLTCSVVLCSVCWYKNIPHDDVIKWKHFSRYWPFVRGIHRSPVNSAHKGQWRGALMFTLICVWINGGVNNRKADDLRRNRVHYDVIVMKELWSIIETKS